MAVSIDDELSSRPASRRQRLREVGLLFLKLGATAFGGPSAHIAMMEEEVVRRRQWVSHEEFLDLLGAANLIPGPNSTELAIHLGHRRAGWPGLLVAGLAFILPAFAIVLTIAWAYIAYGRLPQAAGVLHGITPVIIAIVGQALWRLGRTAIKTPWLAVLALGSLAATVAGANELAVLLGAGLAAACGRARLLREEGRACAAPLALAGWSPSFASASGAAVVTTTALPFSLWALLLFFLKVGSVLFGSGYVLLAFLQTDLVERWGWLTQRQLLDAVAVGQFTPGPVFTTATFIGYVLGGVPGAVVATIGIFLPAFLFVALSGRLIPKLRRSPRACAFLDGVNVASLALMLAVTWQLGRSALVDWLTLGLAVGSAWLISRWRINSAWLVLGGGALGLLAARF